MPHFGMLLDQRVEVARLADHHFAAHNRLNAVMRRRIVRQDSLPGKAKRDDLAPARRVGLELRQYPRPDEHHLIAWSAGLAERASRLHLEQPVWQRVEKVGKAWFKPRRNQCFAQRCDLPRRLCSPTRHSRSPVLDDTPLQRNVPAGMKIGSPARSLPSRPRTPKSRPAATGNAP